MDLRPEGKGVGGSKIRSGPKVLEGGPRVSEKTDLFRELHKFIRN